MPYLKIQTNQEIGHDASQDLMENASRLVAEKLGKSEKYVMVVLEPPIPIFFGGDDEPAVFMELKSIGLSEEQTPALSAALCGLAEDALGISQERIYIEFMDAPRRMWGWKGATF